MKRFGLFLTLLMCVLLGVGCMPGYGQDVLYGQRQPDDRRAPRDQGRYEDRLHRDARDYVRILDDRLRLDRRQQNRILRLLDERTDRLLDRAHPRDRVSLYPFPRRFDQRRQRDEVERWWNATDREIERYLDRRQRDAYRSLTRQDNYPYNRRYDDRRRDQRYDNQPDRRFDAPRYRGGDDDYDDDHDD